MDFIKTFGKQSHARMDFGRAILEEGKLEIKIKSKTHNIREVGLIDGGIGCVMEKRDKERDTPVSLTTRNLSDGDIPANLMSTGYKFRIPAEKISDTEYVFMFDKASMVK